MKILVAEDGRIVAKLLSGLLVERGHQVEVYSTLAELRERLIGPPPDRCLLDLVLANGEVAEVIDDLRRAWPHTPFAIWTASSPQHHPRIEGVKVLQKPCTLDEILAVLDEVPNG